MQRQWIRKWSYLLACAVAATGLTAMSGCNGQMYGYKQDSQHAYTTQSARDAAPRQEAPREPAPRQTTAAPAPAPRMADGLVWSSLAYPTGDRSTSGVLVEKGIPREVSVGQTFEYIIRVTNLTNLALTDVVVTDDLPENFRVDSADPNWQSRDGGDARWVFTNLGPREVREIRVRGSASQVGSITACATVSYNTQLCTVINVVQPALQLAKTMTPSVLQCEEIIVRYTVSNSGSGAAQNVEIVDNLPDGLVTVNDMSAVKTPVGTLAPGESKTFEIKLKATKTGTFTNRAVATAAGGLESESSAQTVVTKPQLAITKEGRETLFLGRDLTYTINVRNTGNGEARNTVIEDALASNLQFVSASDGGTLSGGNVVWNVGTLAPDASKRVTLTVRPTAKANFRNVATARAFCADAVTATVDTSVEGIPALLLDGVDDPDPIEIGGTTTYTLTVTNQGSANLTNVRLVCTMDEGDTMEFVSANTTMPTGAAGTARGLEITFPAIGQLAPGASATYRIVIRAKAAGQVSFRAEAVSNEITRPLIKVETTNFYQ